MLEIHINSYFMASVAIKPDEKLIIENYTEVFALTQTELLQSLTVIATLHIYPYLR